jgi:hypothetical protein
VGCNQLIQHVGNIRACDAGACQITDAAYTVPVSTELHSTDVFSSGEEGNEYPTLSCAKTKQKKQLLHVQNDQN